MNWERIAIFALLGYLVPNGVDHLMPGGSSDVEIVLPFAAVVLVFAWFSYVQRARALLHLGLAASIAWLLNLALTAISGSVQLYLAIKTLPLFGAIAGLGWVVGLLGRKLLRAQVRGELE